MDDEKIMALAFAEAKKGIGLTWQNPVVGAVICKDNQILATGYHHQFGQHHAEIDALSHLQTPKETEGATMYVTMEPCSHFGKTPPCAKKLVAVGIKKVIIGQRDPNPLVAGKGINILKDHGISVKVLNTTGELNEAYNFFYRHHRPLVTLKYAMSLDGKLNYQAGQRTRLTGDAAFADSQALRIANQAILVGEKTLTVDDPKLTVRTASLPFPPIRIGLVNNADKLPLSAQLFQQEAPVWLLTRTKSTRQWPKFVHVFQDQNWAPQTIVEFLAKQGIQSLLVEGGSHVLAAFTAADLADQLQVYLAPLILGGGGLPAVFGKAASTIEKFKPIKVRQLGSDVVITAGRD